MTPVPSKGIADMYRALLDDAVKETGVDLKTSSAELALYMADRTTHLASIAHEPGFAQAVTAERNSVALRAGLSASDNAHSADLRTVGMIGGALRMVALLLA